jgi:hypothetical protein
MEQGITPSSYEIEDEAVCHGLRRGPIRTLNLRDGVRRRSGELRLCFAYSYMLAER